MIAKGDKAKEFCGLSQDNKEICLKDFLGEKDVILYFYPKDNTPGCTKEACSFRDNIENIERKNTVVIGVSPDSIESHNKFITKHNLNFILLSDPEHKIAEDYGVWLEKKMFGKTKFGIKRTTFIIGKDGTIKHIFKKVNTTIHAEEVLDVMGNNFN
ncbi:MAG: thioredoxin-dependent thiol peroxidase [Calditrichia bacterium]|nr:thioredoxin-dependent thiol peroxidase [Calditrichia bacterium]